MQSPYHPKSIPFKSIPSCLTLRDSDNVYREAGSFQASSRSLARKLSANIRKNFFVCRCSVLLPIWPAGATLGLDVNDSRPTRIKQPCRPLQFMLHRATALTRLYTFLEMSLQVGPQLPCALPYGRYGIAVVPLPLHVSINHPLQSSDQGRVHLRTLSPFVQAFSFLLEADSVFSSSDGTLKCALGSGNMERAHISHDNDVIERVILIGERRER